MVVWSLLDFIIKINKYWDYYLLVFILFLWGFWYLLLILWLVEGVNSGVDRGWDRYGVVVILWDVGGVVCGWMWWEEVGFRVLVGGEFVVYER